MIRGTLDRLHLGDLMQWFQMGGLTGRLTVLRGRQERRLDFFDGRVVFASSLVPSERLATWLAREGLLPATSARRLLGLSLLRRTLFTDLVLDEGDLGADDLSAAVTRLAETMISHLLLASELEFVFDPDYPIRNLLNLNINVEPHSLLMEAARQSDESDGGALRAEEEGLPSSGEAFERLFWELIREGVSADEAMDGGQLVELHQTLRNIMRTLLQWLSSSPGLVPLPAAQADLVAELSRESGTVPLSGLPHAAWNQMVLGCAIRSDQVRVAQTLDELQEIAAELGLWSEMTATDSWRRPAAGRLDELTRDAAVAWAKAAAAAAPRLGVDPGAAALAAHLLTVPTDLVLWVLTAVPLAHGAFRRTLLRELPRRLGDELARRADFSDQYRRLFDLDEPSLLGACLHLGRGVIPSAPLWPTTAPDDQQLWPAAARASDLEAAEEDARRAIEGGA